VNVKEYSLAAAAEAAGYRACYRCRPYRSETPMGWTGPELVCRAVRLIVAGALDGQTEDELGSRLAVSARHLRRLFGEHLGVTPDQLARSRRAHFARRLLDDTDMTIAEIAFASGFGSVRQFNRDCIDIFRSTPGELRARRRATDRLVADGGVVLRLPYHGQLDWTAMLDYFAARAIRGVESVSGGAYRRTIEIEGDPGVLELSRGGADHLLLRAHLPHWEWLIHVVQRARRIFNLDADAETAARHLASDPIVGQRLRTWPGIRPPGTWDPFEAGVRAIVGQQVSVAGTIMGRIIERVGIAVPGLTEMRLTHVFPIPTALAAADLSGLGLTDARAAAIGAFATAVAGGKVQLDGAERLDRLVDSLTRIPGLGPWTAHYIAFRMGERDAFPASDLGIRRALRANGPQTISPRQAEELAERWRPWRAHAAAHLWLGDRTDAASEVA
jgi:AraC family transcriptional regulator of adaptative response / DNA-3-methyladenine glycosylase II